MLASAHADAQRTAAHQLCVRHVLKQPAVHAALRQLLKAWAQCRDGTLLSEHADGWHSTVSATGAHAALQAMAFAQIYCKPFWTRFNSKQLVRRAIEPWLDESHLGTWRPETIPELMLQLKGAPPACGSGAAAKDESAPWPPPRHWSAAEKRCLWYMMQSASQQVLQKHDGDAERLLAIVALQQRCARETGLNMSSLPAASGVSAALQAQLGAGASSCPCVTSGRVA